ncbi:MAG: hypothetical protein ABIR26_00180 [Ramlibacter sp.]
MAEASSSLDLRVSLMAHAAGGSMDQSCTSTAEQHGASYLHALD